MTRAWAWCSQNEDYGHVTAKGGRQALMGRQWSMGVAMELFFFSTMIRAHKCGKSYKVTITVSI